MKAGSVGSNPTGVATAPNARSQALAVLLRDVGNAVFALNTAVVGLDAVEKGHKKPTTLDISWRPNDRKTAARTSRRLIVESVMIRVSEAFKQYILAVSELGRFKPTKAQWRHNTSVSEKISTISTEAVGKDNYLTSAVVLLVHWRNRVVHRGSRAKLMPGERRLLLENSTIICERYRGLDVAELLTHFDSQRPTLKDVSSMIAMAINLAKRIDRVAHQDLTKDDLDSWLEHYQIFSMLERVKRETPPSKYGDAAVRLIRSEAPKLLDAYRSHYGSG